MVTAVDRHPAAFQSQPAGSGKAQAPAGAGDQGALVVLGPWVHLIGLTSSFD
jgi:hypothetical protein